MTTTESGATPPMTVLAICGSLRRDSFNRAVRATLPELAPDGMRIEIAPDIGTIPLYNGDDEDAHGPPTPVTALAASIRSADGVVIVTPEYNYSVPGVLKNTLDWLSRGKDQPFAGKPVAIQSASRGMFGGVRSQHHLRQILVALDAFVLAKPEVLVRQAGDRIDAASGRLSDEQTRAQVARQLAAFAALIERLQGK